MGFNSGFKGLNKWIRLVIKLKKSYSFIYTAANAWEQAWTDKCLSSIIIIIIVIILLFISEC